MATHYRGFLRRLVGAGACALAGLAVTPTVQAQVADATPIAISQIAGDVYLARSGTDATVFVATDAGIVLVDPLSTQTARRLKDEFSRRYPDRPVRHVVYTSHRFDRASGAAEFEDTAEVVGHELFKSELSRGRRELTPFLAALDLNHDGRLSALEVEGAPVAQAVMSRDRDGDGSVTTDELYRNVRDPGTVFAGSRRLDVGRATITLVHAPLTRDPDAVAVFFPAERLVFASILPGIAPWPAPFGSNQPGDLERWFTRLSELAFDRLISGNGDEFTHAQIAAAAADLSRLHESVVGAILSGQSIQQTQAGAAGGAFQGEAKRGRDEQIASLFASLHLIRTSYYAVAGVHLLTGNGTFCEKYSTCETGGIVPGGGAGMTISVGRVGADVSLVFGRQYNTTRDAALYAEVIGHRDVAFAALLRVLVVSPLPHDLSFLPKPFAVVAGLTGTRADAQGVRIVKALGRSTSGRAPLNRSTTETGLTVGADYALAPGGRIMVPIRATHFMLDSSADVDRGAWQIDVGISVAVGRHAYVR